MDSGNSPGIEVDTSSLRSVAKTWDQEAHAIGTIPEISRQLHLNHITAGVFQLIVSPYEALLNEVADRSAQGEAEMAKIATELRKTAATYEETEIKNTGLARQHQR